MTRSTQAPDAASVAIDPAVVDPVADASALDGPGVDGPGVDGPGVDGPGVDGAVPGGAGTDRPLRADARRNRETLLETAAALFEERGIEVPLEEIARQAKVGIGTLYRHFPTRDVLIEAAYRREVAILCSGVDELLAAEDPDAALASWMRSFAVYVARKRGMATALKSMMGVDSELFTQSRQSIQDSINTLVTAAVQAGRIRRDADPTDLLRALSGICMANDQPGFSEQTGRIVDLLLDGLRYGAPNPVRA